MIKTTSILLISVLASYGVAAANDMDDFNIAAHTNAIAPLGVAKTSPDTARQIDEANRHDREIYDAALDAGGCSADFLPYAIAAGCFNIATHNDENAAIGASRGGD